MNDLDWAVHYPVLLPLGLGLVCCESGSQRLSVDRIRQRPGQYSADCLNILKAIFASRFFHPRRYGCMSYLLPFKARLPPALLDSGSSIGEVGKQILDGAGRGGDFLGT